MRRDIYITPFVSKLLEVTSALSSSVIFVVTCFVSLLLEALICCCQPIFEIPRHLSSAHSHQVLSSFYGQSHVLPFPSTTMQPHQTKATKASTSRMEEDGIGVCTRDVCNATPVSPLSQHAGKICSEKQWRCSNFWYCKCRYRCFEGGSPHLLLFSVAFCSERVMSTNKLDRKGSQAERATTVLSALTSFCQCGLKPTTNSTERESQSIGDFACTPIT